MSNLLVIDDHDSIRDGLAHTLLRQGHAVATARSGEEGVALFAKSRFDCVITDLRMSGMDGVGVIRELKRRDPAVVVILMTAFGTAENVESALEEGAFFFIEKPVKPDVMRAVVKAGLTLSERLRKSAVAEARIEALEQERVEVSGGSELIGTSEPMNRLRAAVTRVAATDATVLVNGESGTGKELVARAIHDQSPRKDGPFVAVHCAALAESLLESELFGHEKGAFTGAHRRKLGRFELAHGGTLFLDEVGEIPLSMQARLLRVLQQKEIQRVGGEETLHVDVRLVSATHRDLKAEVQKGTFREDLYYRLHIVPLVLPPLRERPGDVAQLAQTFAARHGPRILRAGVKFSAASLERMAGYRWPGNVRELENTVEQALVFAEGDEIQPHELPAFLGGGGPRPTTPAPTAPGSVPSAVATPAAGAPTLPPGITVPSIPLEGPVDLNSILEGLERQLLVRAFDQARGVKTEASRLLSIKTSALYYKLEKYGLVPGNEGGGESK